MKLNEIYYIISISSALLLAIIYSVNKLASERKFFGESFFSFSVFRKYTLVETVMHLLLYFFGSIIGVCLFFGLSTKNVADENTNHVGRVIITENIFMDNIETTRIIIVIILLIISIYISLLYNKIIDKYKKSLSYKKKKGELLFRNISSLIMSVIGILGSLSFFILSEDFNIYMGIITYIVCLLSAIVLVVFIEVLIDRKRVRETYIYMHNNSSRIKGTILYEKDTFIIIEHSKGVSHINKNIISSIIFCD